MTAEIFTWADQAADQDSGGVRRSLIPGQGADLTRIEIPAGTRGARHSHAFEQFNLVEKGRLQLTTEEGTRLVVAGQVFRFAPDSWHQALFEEDTVLLEINLRA